MTTWGEIQLGRMVLRETYELAEQISPDRGWSVTLAGQESTPPLGLAELRRRREDLAGSLGLLVPVRFTNKPDRDGYYVVTDVQTGTVDWTVDGGEQAGYFNWQLTLGYAGPDTSTDLESRLTRLVRANDHGQIGETWSAPAGGHHSYWTGTTQPIPVVRTGQEGAVSVYRGLTPGINPRWGCPVAGYGSGRSRFLLDGFERVGENLTTSASGTGWEMSNSLVRVRPGSGNTLDVATWDGGDWVDKSWNLSVGSSGGPALSGWSGLTVLRNNYEAVSIRLDHSLSPGRILCDLTLRRGSRFVEGYLQSDRSTLLAVWRATAEAGTAPPAGGFVTASADDTDGNRYVVGTARSFTAQLVQGGLYRVASVVLDFYFGVAYGGSAAVAGDTAINLQDQYIGAMPELVTAVRR